MLMRIRILNPNWKKTDPDSYPGQEHLIKIYLIFDNQSRSVNYFLLFADFVLKLDKPRSGFFVISFFISSDLGFQSKKVFFPSFW